MSNLVTLENVTKIYNKGDAKIKALNCVNLTIPNNSFIALAGPSGSGKTTALRIIGAQIKPTEGKVFFEDVDITSLKGNQLADFRYKKTGFIFQDFRLIDSLNLKDNVFMGLLAGYRSKVTAEQREWYKFLLNKMGLEDREKHYPSELSGGQKQKVAIMRALIKRPPLILADEPTANLDSAMGLEVIEVLHELCSSAKLSVIFSSHDIRILERVNHVIWLRDGMVEEEKVE